MKIVRFFTVIISLLLCVVMLFGITACGRREPEATPSPTPTLPPPPPPSTPEPTPEPVALSPYTGRVEHIFLQEVIAYPELAFDGGVRQENLDAEYITAYEFRRILEELYNNNFVLINLNEVYTTYTTEAGFMKMMQDTFDFPAGKKPLIISFDSMNFNEANRQYGFMSRYIIGTDGEIWVQGTDPSGAAVVSQDLAAITILDKFVREYPAFSHNGAKGCLSLTGSQGILGYRTQKVDLDAIASQQERDAARRFRMQEIASVVPIIDKLKETGWYFGSHTYERIALGNRSLEVIQTDAERWFDEVGSLVGETQILTYPAGSRLDGRDQDAPGVAFQYYVSIGFHYFASYGSQHYVQIKSDNYNIAAVIADRAYMSGSIFRVHRTILSRFFDVAEIFDPMRPDYGNNWEE